MLVDLGARNKSLDNDYGTTRGPNAAAYHDVALLDADGVELTSVNAPGYARPRILPADWPAAVGGQKSALTVFPDSTDEWVPAASWALHGSDGLVWDSADLVDPLLVTGAGDGPTLTVTIFYTT